YVLVRRVVRYGVDALHQRRTTQRQRDRGRGVDSPCALDEWVVSSVFRGAHEYVLHCEGVERRRLRAERLDYESGRPRSKGGRLTRSPEEIPRVGSIPGCRHYIGRCEGDGARLEDVVLQLPGRDGASGVP